MSLSGSLDDLAHALAQVGRSVRDALLTAATAADGRVVRRAGGDDIYGLDDRADRVLLAELERRCRAGRYFAAPGGVRRPFCAGY